MREAQHLVARRGRPRWRVGVFDSNARSRAEVARLIESRGAAVVVASAPRFDSVALLCRMAPDAVVLAAEDAMRADRALDRRPLDVHAPVVLVADPTTAGTLEPARMAGVMGLLLTPLRPEEVRPTLEVAIARFRELRRLRRVLAERPVVEAAKARLMARDGLSEPAAYGWLRRRAMDERVGMGEVARGVLERDARPDDRRGGAVSRPDRRTTWETGA
jgi:AmiR/NasT family two-component response regulator